MIGRISSRTIERERVKAENAPPPRAQMEGLATYFTIFTYVLAKHYGVAPCVHNGRLSLALCKVAIRQTTGKKNGVGDVLVGLRKSQRGQPQYTHYIAIVSHIVTLEEFYAENSKYRGRPDCICAWRDGEMMHLGGRFHADNKDPRGNFENQRKDKEGFVLICEKFHIYEYNDAPEATYVKNYLTQGHHANDDDQARTFIMELIINKYLLTAGEGAAGGSGNNGPAADNQMITARASAARVRDPRKRATPYRRARRPIGNDSDKEDPGSSDEEMYNPLAAVQRAHRKRMKACDAAPAPASTPSDDEEGDDDGSSVVGGDVQNGPVLSRGLTTAGAPPMTTAKGLKRSIRTSGSMAPELLLKYQQLHLLILGRKHVGELEFPYSENGSFGAYVNLDKVMDADAFYTDATFCAMDAFNLGVGQPVLNRQIINSPFDSDKGVSYEMVKPAIEAAGFSMVAVVSGSKKKRTYPTMIQILGLVSGVFFVEFFWKNKSGDRDFHVVAVNCDQRRVFCSTLGVIPFAAGKKHESAATHAQVVGDLKIRDVYRVYRIVQRKI